MASKNVGSKRQDTDDPEVPAELEQREAQDRPKSEHGGGARSPVDSMHVDAPKHQDNARGHRQERNQG
jgi:hypothetical protein